MVLRDEERANLKGGYIFAKNLDICSYWPHMKTFRPLKKNSAVFFLCVAQPLGADRIPKHI